MRHLKNLNIKLEKSVGILISFLKLINKIIKFQLPSNFNCKYKHLNINKFPKGQKVKFKYFYLFHVITIHRWTTIISALVIYVSYMTYL